MLVSSLTPKTEEWVKFSLDVLWKVPEESGCYVITNYDGVILYIGQAVNIHNRMEQHLNDGEKRGKTPWGVAFWFYYLLCPKLELNDLERGWVNEHRLKEKGQLPFFNKVNPPV